MRTFLVNWEDLDAMTQQSMIDSLKITLSERCREEGQEFLRRSWATVTPKTWEEAYCRLYTIDFSMWDNAKDAASFDWALAVDQHIEQSAEAKLVKACRGLKVTV